jgi:hypothetical protein
VCARRLDSLDRRERGFRWLSIRAKHQTSTAAQYIRNNHPQNVRWTLLQTTFGLPNSLEQR